LVAGSILQNHYEFEGALMKYRICSVLNPDSPELWNNIGMCFYGKNKIIAVRYIIIIINIIYLFFL